MGSFGGFEWLIILLIVIFFFGAKKIPQMARGLGQGYVEFKKASRKDDEKEKKDAGSIEKKTEDRKETRTGNETEHRSEPSDRNASEEVTGTK